MRLAVLFWLRSLEQPHSGILQFSSAQRRISGPILLLVLLLSGVFHELAAAEVCPKSTSTSSIFSHVKAPLPAAVQQRADELLDQIPLSVEVLHSSVVRFDVLALQPNFHEFERQADFGRPEVNPWCTTGHAKVVLEDGLEVGLEVVSVSSQSSGLLSWMGKIKEFEDSRFLLSYHDSGQALGELRTGNDVRVVRYILDGYHLLYLYDRSQVTPMQIDGDPTLME